MGRELSAKSKLDCVKGDSSRGSGPCLARDDRHGLRQRAGADNLAGRERRIDRIARQQANEITQRLIAVRPVGLAARLAAQTER
jgi:hypothetical protein